MKTKTKRNEKTMSAKSIARAGAFGLLTVVCAACGVSHGAPVEVGAPPSTLPAAAAKQWLVPPSKKQEKVPADAGNVSAEIARGAATEKSAEAVTKGESRSALAPTDQLVAAVSKTLPTPLPLNYANRVDNGQAPTWFVSFGTHGAATVTIVITQLRDSVAPTLGDDSAFTKGYKRRSDGVEQYVDDGNGSRRFAVQSVKPSGLQIVVAAEGPPTATPLVTPDQVNTITEALLRANLPLPT